jgi:hypothetical protein
VDGDLDRLDVSDPADLGDFHAHREALYGCLGPRLREEILRAIRTEIAVAQAAARVNTGALADARRRLAVEGLPSYEERARARNV